MTIFSIIVLILMIINGLHCIILHWVLRSYLIQLGKEEYFFGTAGYTSGVTELYKRAKSNNNLDKYKKFIYYFVIANTSEAVLFITFFISMSWNTFF